jgi:hypothetical protein
VSRLLVVDPATVALHEVAEPSRLRALVRQLRASRVQDTPVLVTDEPHGLLVLDGVHRTKALLSLGVPRMLAVHLPRERVADPDGWTHRLRRPHVVEEVLGAIRSQPGVTLRPVGQTTGLPAAATVVTAEGSWTACAVADDPRSRVAAYRAVAETYQGHPYDRVAVPDEPGEDELQVRWEAPPLTAIEEMVARHGALPAGVTRFALPDLPAGCRVTFDELAGATDPEAAADLLRRLDPHRD